MSVRERRKAGRRLNLPTIGVEWFRLGVYKSGIPLWGVRGARGLEPGAVGAEVGLSCLRPWEWGEWREEAGRVKER